MILHLAVSVEHRLVTHRQTHDDAYTTLAWHRAVKIPGCPGVPSRPRDPGSPSLPRKPGSPFAPGGPTYPLDPGRPSMPGRPEMPG